jgi:hypothetical protein
MSSIAFKISSNIVLGIYCNHLARCLTVTGYRADTRQLMKHDGDYRIWHSTSAIKNEKDTLASLVCRSYEFHFPTLTSRGFNTTLVVTASMSVFSLDDAANKPVTEQDLEEA